MACIRKRRGKLILDYVDANRRRRWEAFPATKAGQEAAEIRKGEVLKARRSGAAIDDRVTVTDFTVQWLNIVDATTLAPATQYLYRHATERFTARFGPRRLASLRPTDLMEFGAELLRGGLQRATVAHILGIVGILLQHGVRCGLLLGNATTGIARVLKLRVKGSVEIKAMSEEQLARFLAAVKALKHPAERMGLQLYAYTGLRLGEGLGLEVGDYDQAEQRLRVRQQRRQGGSVARLKTQHSLRSVDLPAIMSTMVADDLARRRVEALRRGRGVPAFLLEETSRVGLQRAMARAIAAAALPTHFTVHSLRHTFATIHLVRGKPLLWVSRQLGHSSVSITADTYAAWIQPESPGAADEFAERIARQKADLPSGRLLTITR